MDDVLHFSEVGEVLLEFLPVVIELLDFVEVVLLQSALQRLYELAQNYQELLASVVYFGQRKLVAKWSVSLVLLPRPLVELEGIRHLHSNYYNITLYYHSLHQPSELHTFINQNTTYIRLPPNQPGSHCIMLFSH